MNREEKEQWLYEEYQYTSNFDFSRLDKYEEANDDLCIDDLILDYTMLYELYKQEIERLNKTLEDIDTYIHLWKLEEIGEKTMLILNDILLIKNGMGNEVVRLKGSDKE